MKLTDDENYQERPAESDEENEEGVFDYFDDDEDEALLEDGATDEDKEAIPIIGIEHQISANFETDSISTASNLKNDRFEEDKKNQESEFEKANNNNAKGLSSPRSTRSSPGILFSSNEEINNLQRDSKTPKTRRKKRKR